MVKLVKEKEYEIQYYDIDYSGRLLMSSLMRYLGDIATRQSEDIGIGIDYLKEKGIAWVIYKWSIKIDRCPKYGEKIKIKTIPYSFRKFYAYRTFEIIDDDGKTIGKADSIWFLIDIEKRKAIRIKEELYKAYGVEESNKDILEIEKVNPPEHIHSDKSFDVRYSDIDTNSHVNNVRYLEWAIETVPLDIVLNCLLKSTNITYQKETTYGEDVRVLTEINKEDKKYICVHKIIDKAKRELALLETQWEIENKCC
ncbi:acyl-[acyl-carrier-protein] thioesterase [Clostridium sp. DJ247]|uniref:acyl-[acyl-carrier-protein] thioesterase n=1 Tax=Clostridium sp. DJ247 TaxID=2726188 RepID=UPI00162A321B|nr:acyl-ACP thioesterase domain-containing protein [Clostridium sp. DJ247]MBC2582201.1 acyl-ACP thioesterase [Clostridium sp. DJ247]